MQRFPLTLLFSGLLGLCVPVYPATIYTGTLTGSQEVPPNASPATGFVTLTINGDILMVDLSWDGLIGGNPAASHIHCCTPPGNNVTVAIGFPGFPAVTSGTYSNTFDLTDPAIYTDNFRNNFGGGTGAGAEAALLAGLAASQAYVNIHNAVYPGGEIRADIVPEPASMGLAAAGLAVLLLRNMRRGASRRSRMPETSA
jgi:hypothetical protein